MISSSDKTRTAVSGRTDARDGSSAHHIREITFLSPIIICVNCGVIWSPVNKAGCSII
jgi:hypothetical protein